MHYLACFTEAQYETQPEEGFMKIEGRRIHIAGSASAACDLAKLNYAHTLVAALSRAFLQRNAAVCAQVGKEPLHKLDAKTSIIFDWTVIQTVSEFVQNSSFDHGAKLLPLTTVITEKTDGHIPEARKVIWESLLRGPYVRILDHPIQWTAGAVRRDRIAAVGDILILISGGEGVEHLAQLYIGQRKPVLALDLDLGASTEQGNGRAVAINKEISSNPTVYFSPKEPEAIGALWNNLSTRGGTRPMDEVVTSILALLGALEPPVAFCVRLLDPTSAKFRDVDNFFTRIVTPAIQSLDYKVLVSPQSPSDSHWMNVDIFTGIHDSALVIVDLTDERPNCFIELGYALGRNRRVLISAIEGTKLPFDVDKIESFFWSSSDDKVETAHRFGDYVERNLTQAPLVPTLTLF